MVQAMESEIKASMLNACWWVRHYKGCRNSRKRAQAILFLGLCCQEAFNSSQDYEQILKTLIDGLFTEDREIF